MDLFNKARLKLDSVANSLGLRDLCKLGILKPSKYLKALSLIKNDSYWNKVLYNSFMILGVVFAVLAGFVYLHDKWDSMAFIYKSIISQMIFIIAVAVAFFARIDKIVGRIFLVIAIMDIGFMLSLISERYPTLQDSWVVYFQWLALISLWVIACRSSLIWVFWVGVANYTWVLWGYQFAIPQNIITWQFLLIFMCLFDLIMLVMVEIFETLFIKKDKPYLWIVLLGTVFSISIFLAGYDVIMSEFFTIQVGFFFIVSAFLWWFYYCKYPKYYAALVVASSVAIFVFIASIAVGLELLDDRITNIYNFVAIFAVVEALQVLLIAVVLSGVIIKLNNQKNQGFMV